MTVYSYSEELFSDLHKDACGFRPRGDHRFYSASPEEKQKIWDSFRFDVERDIAFSRVAAEEAILAFDALVAKYQKMGAGSRETALAWIADAEGFEHPIDIEMWVHDTMGLEGEYAYLTKKLLCKVTGIHYMED
ncbi:MAG: hypothetical protein WCY93_07865 [Anaerolineaceae bacterium]